MKRKIILAALALVAGVSLASCGDNSSQNSSTTPSSTNSGSTGTSTGTNTGVVASSKDDLTKKVDLKFNLAYGNKSQTMTYAQATPLTMPDGKTTISSGQLKPFWTYLSNQVNSTFTDVTVQDQKGKDMITTAAATGFKDATVFGGNSIGESLMSYGTQGKFVNLAKLMDEGELPNFKAYLDVNPDIRTAITAYDGGIYHMPYIAELGEYAHVFHMRETWVKTLLDGDSQKYDESTSLTTYYQPFWTGNLARTGANGGTVTPKEGVTITKKTNQNVIALMNALSVKNGKTLAECLKQYIKDNYSYDKASELFLGEKAAYDIDEMVALFRVIKANPKLLSDGKVDEVYPFFTRQSKYREDILRFATYFDGIRAHGSDSYGARWEFDANGQIQYTYSKESLYDSLERFSDMYAEGLFYEDIFDLKNTGNFRSVLYGTDKAANPQFGFMTYDFTASTTADGLNDDVVCVLPPVSRINGVWQYYIDNSRVIKPDGWSISAAASEAEIYRAATVFDWFFTEEGAKCQNYGLPGMLDENNSFTGPNGIVYPKYAAWTLDTATSVAKGDLSTFLRNWIGALMPVGYAKEIGFEYQYTSQRGFDGWALLNNSTCNMPTYAGNGIAGDNPNFYKLVPPIFSLTKKQNETLATDTKLNSEGFFEILWDVVRYRHGGAPTGATVPANYAEYLAKFNEGGLETYIKIYQASYTSMKATQGK